MPATDSPMLIVARYLKANNYTKSYEAFLDEAGLTHDAGVTSKNDLTLETLLEEKRTFDLASQFEKLGVQDEDHGWTKPAPANAGIVGSLPTTSNVLATRVEKFGDDASSSQVVLLASTADRRVNFLDIRSKACKKSVTDLHDSPVLTYAVLRGQYLLSASMSGQLHVSDVSGSVLDKHKDHSKYIVKIAVTHHEDHSIVATAGWDNKVVIYRSSTADGAQLGEPFASISLPTKPEAIVFTQHPTSDQPVLLLSRTDSNFIFYYSIEQVPRLLGKQNLAPHSNAWVAFTPSALEICPTDATLIAVATSSMPHMKLLIIRLLFPPWNSVPAADTSTATPQVRTSLLDSATVTETQASQARAALAVAEKEAAAILIHCTTMAPQTAYSTPAAAWRPDGSGVWVNGDDGAIRGIEASTGKIVSTLRGHEPGSKVRCLWAGSIDDGDTREEVLVSGGFDQKLIIWDAASV